MDQRDFPATQLAQIFVDVDLRYTSFVFDAFGCLQLLPNYVATNVQGITLFRGSKNLTDPSVSAYDTFVISTTEFVQCVGVQITPTRRFFAMFEQYGPTGNTGIIEVSYDAVPSKASVNI